MTQIALKIFLSAIVAGVLCIDRNAFGQFQLSRPMVSGMILGIILGCPTVGLVVGLIYELLFLISLPVGSFVPYHPLFPSLASVLLIGVYGGPNQPFELLGFAVLLGMPTVFLDRAVNIQWRRSNERTFQKAMVYLRLGRTDLAQVQHVLAGLRAGVYHGGSFFITGIILVPLFHFLVKSTSFRFERLSVVAILPFLVGLAGLVSDRTEKRGWLGFSFGLAAGTCVGIWRLLS